MTTPTLHVAGFALVSFLASGCSKPCEAIPTPDDVKSYGFVLDGGQLCESGKSTATIDYPKIDADKLVELHKDKLTKDGWKVETPSEGVLFATREARTLFVVTAKRSSERRVPFAVVRFCDDETCRKSLAAVAEEMKKQ